MSNRSTVHDEDRAKDCKTKAELERVQELEDLKTILGTKAGIRFFRRLFDKAHIFHTTFTGNSHTFFLEGHRNLALMILEDIRIAAPERVAEIMITVEGRDGKSRNGYNDAAN